MELPSDRKHATVRVRRPKQWVNAWRDYRILLDGEEVARVRNGEESRLRVRPGAHRIQVKVDWCSSPPELLMVREDDDEIRFDCGCHHTGWRLLFLWRAIRTRPHEFLWLRRVARESDADPTVTP